MRGPRDEGRGSARMRRAASVAARRRYPAGKALGRIQYFEIQRGLPATGLKDGRVLSAAGSLPASRSGARRAGAMSVRPTRLPYAQAIKTKQHLAPATFKAAVGLPVWQPLGPHLIPKGQTYGSGSGSKPAVSGRCNGIVISPNNPNRLVLCSAGGGLWGSQNGGGTWTPLTDEAPTLSMGAIAAAPSSPNILYAATGEGDTYSQLGVGLLRSSDGGGVWEHLASSVLTGVGVWDLAVHPTDPLKLWAGTFRGLFESTNGGSAWRQVRGGLCWDISVNPADPQEVLIATERGVLRSANGGSSWSAVSLPGATGEFDRLEVCHAPSNPAIVYVAGCIGGRSCLWRRATTGGAFNSETSPRMEVGSDIAQAWYDWCFAISPSDPNLVFWGAVHLYRGSRSASGWRWENISSRTSGDSVHPDQHHLAFDPSNPNVLYVCNDGGLFRSSNAGTNWQSLNPGLCITEFEFLAHLEGQDHWLIGGTQDNGTLSNGAATRWDQIALGDGGDCGADDGTGLCYHSYYGMWIERAPALGPSAFRWSDVSPPFSEDYEALFYPPMDVRGMVVAKAGKSVFVSDDRADHWSEVALPASGEADPDKASALSIIGKSLIVVGTVGGALYRITRAPSGWGAAKVEPLTSPRAGAYISDIHISGVTSKVIWASTSHIGGGHVFRSLNGGRTWSDRSGNLPDIPVNAIVVDPKNTRRVFAATDHGVYRTTNSGTQWKDYSNGLPNVVVGDLILHERRRVLRAGTRNRGAWEIQI